MNNTKIGTLGYNALDIADYIIRYEEKRGHLINNLKLQKILYFLQAQFLVSYNKSLFEEELIAWDFGPIVKSVYYNYKVYGGASIFVQPRNYRNAYIAKEHRKMINEMLDHIRPYSSTQLVDICHKQRPFNHARFKWDNVIALEELREYFKED